MSFSVTAVKQPRGSPLCGPACVSMVLSRYGIRRSMAAIAKALPMTKKGVLNAPLGTYFLREGYDVTMFYWVRGLRPRFMGTRTYNALGRALGAPLTINASDGDRKSWPAAVRSMRTFLDAGGELRLEPVQAHHVETALRRDMPPIVNINPRVLDSYGDRDGGHYVVPLSMSGRDSQVTRPMIHFLDPVSGREQVRYVAEFMHACHVWHGSALFIRPKESGLDFDA